MYSSFGCLQPAVSLLSGGCLPGALCRPRLFWKVFPACPLWAGRCFTESICAEHPDLCASLVAGLRFSLVALSWPVVPLCLSIDGGATRCTMVCWLICTYYPWRVQYFLRAIPSFLIEVSKLF